MNIFKGIGVSDGIAIGYVRFHKKNDKKIECLQSADKDAEWNRFLYAKKRAIENIERFAEINEQLFSAHCEMANDPDFTDAIREMICENGFNAEYSVFSAGEQFASVFESMDDEYMQARGSDVRDVANQIVNELMCKEDISLDIGIPHIFVGADFSPSETAKMNKKYVLGIVTENGSVAGHTSILSKMIGIPSVVCVGHLEENQINGKKAVIDGKNGIFIVEPDEKTLKEYTDKLREYENEMLNLSTLIGKSAETSKGKRIKLFCNISSPDDVEAVIKNDGEGIGLFRSEFLFLSRDFAPNEEDQFAAYKTVLKKMNGKAVIIRTLDIGADKNVSYLNLEKEENPAMGNRAIRLCLKRKDIFRTQLHALFRASVYGNLGIMFPMICDESEITEAKQICDEVKNQLTNENIPYNPNVKIGIMIETPAAAIISDILAKEVDFFSIGTNDLSQYTLAIDRQNSSVQQLFDSHHAAVLRLIKTVCENAHSNGISVGICGELASDTDLLDYFLSIGIDELSVNPGNVLPIRKEILNK